jgi:hypothetical protein
VGQGGQAGDATSRRGQAARAAGRQVGSGNAHFGRTFGLLI